MLVNPPFSFVGRPAHVLILVKRDMWIDSYGPLGLCSHHHSPSLAFELILTVEAMDPVCCVCPLLDFD